MSNDGAQRSTSPPGLITRKQLGQIYAIVAGGGLDHESSQLKVIPDKHTGALYLEFMLTGYLKHPLGLQDLAPMQPYVVGVPMIERRYAN